MKRPGQDDLLGVAHDAFGADELYGLRAQLVISVPAPVAEQVRASMRAMRDLRACIGRGDLIGTDTYAMAERVVRDSQQPARSDVRGLGQPTPGPSPFRMRPASGTAARQGCWCTPSSGVVDVGDDSGSAATADTGNGGRVLRLHETADRHRPEVRTRGARLYVSNRGSFERQVATGAVVLGLEPLFDHEERARQKSLSDLLNPQKQPKISEGKGVVGGVRQAITVLGSVVEEVLVRLLGITACQRKVRQEDLRAGDGIHRHACQHALVVKDLHSISEVLLCVRAFYKCTAGSLESIRDFGRTHAEPQRSHTERRQQLPMLPLTMHPQIPTPHLND